MNRQRHRRVQTTRSPVAVVIAVVLAGSLVACSSRNRGGSSADPASTVGTEPAVASLYEDLPEVEPGVDPAGRLVSDVVTVADGTERSYHLYVPTSSNGAPMPLLVALHGGLGWGLQFRENSGFDRLAEANGFMVVYPDGTPIVENRLNAVWNGGACCGVAADARRGVDDVRFIAMMIDEITDRFDVDTSRIYATGHSNGAIMSYRLACELADTIVAVAVQAGSLEVEDCEPSRPVSVMGLHGRDDTNIPVGGGAGTGPSGHAFVSPEISVERFAQVDHCSVASGLTDVSNADVSGRRWSGCDDGVIVEWVLVDGANHAWMGHEASAVQRAFSGDPYRDLDASLVIWRFLSARSRR